MTNPISATSFAREMNKIMENYKVVELAITIAELREKFKAKEVPDFKNENYYRVHGKLVYIDSKTGKFAVR